MTPNNDIRLQTTGLRIGYRNKHNENLLFDNLHLSLAGGQMVCFMGPNGAGKSTLLRTLAGLQKPLAGKIEPTASDRETAARQIAVVLTNQVHNVNLTVEEVVTFGRYPYLGWNIRLTPPDREIITAAIAQVRLEPILGRKIHELSDGQMQMVMIARALAQDTPIILLDEPTAHLDLNNRLEIMNLLRDLSRKTGKAILLATHELDLALQTADLVWLTGKDHDILTGLPEDLVLNGAFDEIFRFKGFDLKTGKVEQRPFRNISIRVTGSGPAFLWTRNALERSGYRVSDTEQAIEVAVTDEQPPARWVIKARHEVRTADSIADLLKFL